MVRRSAPQQDKQRGDLIETLIIIDQAPHYWECKVNPINQKSFPLSIEGSFGLFNLLSLLGFVFHAIQAKGAEFSSPFCLCPCIDPTIR